MSTLRSAGGKGSLYTDASWRTAAIRKNAILKGQIQKCGTSAVTRTLNSVPGGTSGYEIPDPTDPVFVVAYGVFSGVLESNARYVTARSTFLSAGGSFPLTFGYVGISTGSFYITLTGDYATDVSRMALFFPNVTGGTVLVGTTVTMSYGSIGNCDVLSGPNVLKKPLIGEQHLQKGFTAGVTELILAKNKNGFI